MVWESLLTDCNSQLCMCLMKIIILLKITIIFIVIIIILIISKWKSRQELLFIKLDKKNTITNMVSFILDKIWIETFDLIAFQFMQICKVLLATRDFTLTFIIKIVVVQAIHGDWVQNKYIWLFGEYCSEVQIWKLLYNNYEIF